MKSMTKKERVAFARAGGIARQKQLKLKKEIAAYERQINNGELMMLQMKPYDRIDWEFYARNRKISLFGKEFFCNIMKEKVLRNLIDYSR